MKKKLYYTVEFGLEDESITGNKLIMAYEIVDNVPNRITSFECGNEENSESAILDNLDSEKYPEVELVLL